MFELSETRKKDITCALVTKAGVMFFADFINRLHSQVYKTVHARFSLSTLDVLLVGVPKNIAVLVKDIVTDACVGYGKPGQPVKDEYPAKLIDDVVEDITKFLPSISCVVMRVYLIPDDGFARKIHWKMEKFMSGPFVIDFQLDRDISGGSIVVYEGRTYDYSLRSVAREYLASRFGERNAGNVCETQNVQTARRAQESKGVGLSAKVTLLPVGREEKH